MLMNINKYNSERFINVTCICVLVNNQGNNLH